MANTIDFTAMGEYITRNSDQLLVDSVVGAKSLDYASLMLGVKHKEAIPYLNSTVVLDAAACGWNPQGSDTFGERFVETHTIEIEKSFCFYDFKPYVSNLQMLFEAGRESLPWQEKIAESNVNAVKEAVELMVWQGNSGASVTGWLADAAEASASTVSFGSGDTAVAKVDAIVAALPAKMLAKGVNLFVSFSDFGQYVREMNGACCNRTPIDAASETLTYLGDSRVKIIPVLGLEGLGKMVAATVDNLIYATDLEGSENAYEWFEDKKNSEFDFRIMFNAGTAIRFPDEVVIGE